MTRQRSLRFLALLTQAAVAGYLTNLAFPDPGWWPMAFLGIGSLFHTLGARPWSNAAMGFAFSMTFFLPQLEWANFVVGAMPWVALSVVQSLYPAVACMAWGIVARNSWFTDRPIVSAVSFATLWTAVDEIRSTWPWGGFPWSRLAFSQSDSPVGRFAWLGGATLVTWMTVLIGVLGALGLLAVIRTSRLRRIKLSDSKIGTPARAWVSPALLGGTMTMLVAAGCLIPLSAGAETGEIKIGAVQGNVPGEGLDAFSEQRVVLHNHANRTHELAARESDLDLVVWPENASDIDPDVDVDAAAEIDSAAEAADAPIFLGTIRALPENSRYNLAVMWMPGQGITDSYAKQHPVPFAEYIPWRDFFRQFTDLVDLVHRDMTAGTEVGVVTLESERLDRTISLGVAICFEVATDPVFEDAVAAGAEILIVQTNNANFGPTNESVQQLAMSRLRAIEFGRAVVHVSTVGVSGIYAPDGTEIARSGHFIPDDLTATLPLREGRTPASYIAGYVGSASYLGSAVVIVCAALLGRTIRKRDQ